MCHKVRPDNPENVIRSETSRQICPHSIQPQFTTQRRIGSVTVDNLNNGRYQGEMQIVRQTLSAHDNVNVVAQIIKVQQDIDQRVSHVVVMGTGEPFDNYDNVMEFVRIINHPHGLAIGARHITISTCGLIKGIKRYSEEGIQTNLAISLHAANDEIRDELMPINKVHPMDDLREAISEYIDKTNRRVTFEYIMLKGVNDDIVYARQLAHYLRGLNAYVNLIPYNSVDEHGYQPSDKETVEIFKNELLRLHINVTLRKEHGRDIDGACGQLRAKRSGVK